MKKALDEMLTILYNTFRCVDGLSPNGKATDSDSVIFKVRILVALLQKALESIESFLFTQECVTTDK